MVIIAFSDKTSKIFPRIVCRRFRHCAPIIPMGRDMIMYQFTRPGYVTKIKTNMRGIRMLGAHGWRFVYVPGNVATGMDTTGAYSCVDLSKRMLGIRAPHIQTPDGLYKYLHR